MSIASLQQFLGNRVSALRHKAKLTQAELCVRVGITQVGLSLIENGRSWPKAETLAKLASALGVTPAELFRNISEKSPK
jgi:transcriptional regulator with XRE-family HTH domain